MEKNILEKIEKTIFDASKGRDKLVVGIDGYTGIGKTTILKELAKRNRDIVAVNKDDFLKSRLSFKSLLGKEKDKSKLFEVGILNEKKMRSLMEAFQKNKKNYITKIFNPVLGKIDIEKKYNLAKKVLVIEGIFLFHRLQLDDVFNLRIFLEGDVEKADARRIRREKERWGEDYFPETHPDSYFRLVKIAFKRYLRKQKPKERVDLVVRI